MKEVRQVLWGDEAGNVARICSDEEVISEFDEASLHAGVCLKLFRGIGL